MGSGIKVHKLCPVSQDEVILPRQTLALLERNTVQFLRQREALAERRAGDQEGGSVSHGPAGTGKTHTLHYLVGELKGVTTFLIAAEQMLGLSEYMTLARLLQPSLVVIEDADLIARDRDMGPMGCDAILLNQLLNEMDGLREDADVLFVLTTNRPEVLEPRWRHGRDGLTRPLNSPTPTRRGGRSWCGCTPGVCRSARTSSGWQCGGRRRSAPAFIKELMRRAVQFRLERGGEGGLTVADLDNALDELLFRGGSLNRKLLGSESLGFTTGTEQE